MKKLLPLFFLFSFSLNGISQLQFTFVDPATQTLSIQNFGASPVDISNYWLCALFEYSNLGGTSVVSGDFDLAQNESVTLQWFASSGFNTTASDIGLYDNPSFSNPDNMMCFVEYGTSGQGREPEAVEAGLWVEGTFVSGNSPFTYIGNGLQSGAGFWEGFLLPDDIVINEIDSDTPGLDALEFIELKGSASQVLDGMVIVFFNGSNDQSVEAMDLDGFTCDADGFFLTGNSGVAGALLTFSDNTLQNGADAVALYWGNESDWPNGTMISTTNLIDAVVYDTGQADDAGLLALIISGGQVDENANGNVLTESLSRVPDGGEQVSTSTYIAQLPTPGYSNILPVCDGGFVLTEGGDNDVVVCSDANADEIAFAHMTTEPDALYDYFITDESGDIVQFPAGASFDFNSLAIGVYHVYGIAYYGNFDAASTEVGDPLEEISTDGFCFDLSQTFIEITVQICEEVPECTDLFISEYIEGLSNNKALEIFNPTNLPVDLSDYVLKNYANGGTTPSNILGLTGTLNPGDVYVIVHPGAAEEYQALADVTATVVNFNGNDAIVLEHEGIPIDGIGVVGEDPGAGGWNVGAGTTVDHVLVRKGDVNSPTTDWAVSAALQWDIYAVGDLSFLGSHVFVPCGTTLPQITFTTSAQGVEEDAGVATCTVNIFNPVNEVILTVNIADGSALQTEDYDATGFPLTLTFPQGVTTPQSFTIPIIDDTAEEDGEYFTVTMAADPDDAGLIQDFQNIIIIENDIFYPLYDVAQVTTQNDDGVCDSLEVDCELRGIVHGINFNSAGTNFTLIDATDGVNVFVALDDLGYTVNEGDSIQVLGEVYQFMGLTSFDAVSITLVDGDHPLETATNVDAILEENESHMVRIECVEILNLAQWDNSGNSFNVTVSDGVNNFVLHIDGDTDIFGTDAPEGHFSAIGIGGQFDTSIPLDGGYLMWPRYLTDLTDFVTAQFSADPDVFQYGDADVDVQFTNESVGGFDLSWNFGDGSTSTDSNPIHTYTIDFLQSTNEITVSLVITSDGGCVDSNSVTFDVLFVGVDEVVGNEISIYPNPTNGNLFVRSDSPIRQLDFYDVVGNEVKSKIIQPSAEVSVDISELVSGMYVLIIHSEMGVSRKEIVKF